ncbi:auxin-regulated protein [Silicimonas algicola]|uniref:GH3 auxin-responsive promoter n=1 Tax=Silicimonas algicola TaxID=1826607 RepID=A0A316FYH4_9RHOB|nr:GH3 auxin-responsive promoter family protein [Silicimonas algicola]AZQ66715.1 auxin-regulated protein [Silicimonas algicola]PWK53175.1 GH3 auxin-responsive promoter [Silicimonas algicola]
MLDATPLLRTYTRTRLRRLARLDPVATQRRVLAGLLARARECRFGLEHGFGSIASVEEYQARVPLRQYENFWEGYWKADFPNIGGQTWQGPIPYLAASSGTSTGRTKYLPVGKAMARSNRAAGVDLMAHHLEHCPASRVLGGKNFMLGGTVDLSQLAPGVFCGDLTGIARREAPLWAEPFIFPPMSLAREADWERKMESLGRASLGEPIRTVAGTPNWLLLFFERLAELTGKRRLAEIYPELDLIVHGGMSFAPYRRIFADWLEGSRAELREVYPASEGFIALADRGPGEGLRMLIDNGLFFEFVPVETLNEPAPERHWVGTAELGREYALVVSSNAGLWSYLLGDTVRLIDLNPPRLLVTGRTSSFLSAFGEHLTGEEIEDAVVGAAEAQDAQVRDYAVGAIYPDRTESRGRHLFVIEFEPGQMPDAAAVATGLDQRLSAANEDYEAHRHGDIGMGPPEVLVVLPGTFAEWMRRRGKLGGQNKVPRVILDADLLAGLQILARDRLLGGGPNGA